MLTEFDQNTIANMTAALDFVCKKIPADKDSTELRKKIADELIQCARRTVIDLQNAGLTILKATAALSGFNWFGLRRFIPGSHWGVEVVQENYRLTELRQKVKKYALSATDKRQRRERYRVGAEISST